MLKRIFFGIVLTLLLIGMLTFAYNIQPVRAVTIVVPDDYPTIQGAINAANPGDTVFVKSGTYHLTGSEYIILNKSISLTGESRETTIIDGGYGIHMKVNHVIVEEFTIRNSKGYSIYTGGCKEGAIIRNNIIANNTNSIYLIWGSNHIISGNNITNNQYGGIQLGYCSYATFRNNHMSGNERNFNVDGNDLDEFIHDIDISNTVDGKPIYYWVNEQDRRVPSDAGYVAIVNSFNITVQNLDLEKNEEGVLLAFTENSSITDNNVTDTFYSIRLRSSSDNTVYHNNMIDYYTGISLVDSSNCTIYGNNMTDGAYGISLYTSSDNNIFHNNFLNNTEAQASIIIPGFANVWDDGYPSGGNYWSDYTGVDLYGGSYQNETGSDGIGDTPYVVDENNTDRYPLVIHDVSIINITPYRTVAGQGYSMNISAKVKNQGDCTETFNVTAYANETIIQTKNISLTSGNFVILVFTWNTTGWTIGNYIISANATIVPSETDTADNSYIDGTVTIRLPIHDVAVINVTSAKTVICQACLGNITATVENQGDFVETFNVTAYVNATVIGETSVALPPLSSTDVVFTWNATGFTKGNYTISAVADIVTGETETADNTHVNGWVIVSMLGDITGPDGWPDGKCDMRDIGMVARGFGANRVTNKADPRYGEYWHTIPCDTCPHSPNCDVVYDGKIDMKDIGTTARHFGETDL